MGGQYLLVHPFPPYALMVFLALGPGGGADFQIRIPPDPGLKGIVIHQQALTYGPGLGEISNLADTEITE